MVSVTIGGVVLGDYASVMSKLGMAVLLSFMVALSILPVYIVTVLAAKKHIIPTAFYDCIHNSLFYIIFKIGKAATAADDGIPVGVATYIQ